MITYFLRIQAGGNSESKYQKGKFHAIKITKLFSPTK